MTEVMQSFNRVRHIELAENFYQKLLAADLRIKAMFVHTDFVKQKELFTHGLLMLLKYANGEVVGKIAMNRLAETHSREGMGIDPSLYSIWIDCLVATVRELDPHFDTTLDRLWRQSLQKGIDVMAAAY